MTTPAITFADLRRVYLSLGWCPWPSVRVTENRRKRDGRRPNDFRAEWNNAIRGNYINRANQDAITERNRIISAMRSWAKSNEDDGGREIETNMARMLADKIEMGEL